MTELNVVKKYINNEKYNLKEIKKIITVQVTQKYSHCFKRILVEKHCSKHKFLNIHIDDFGNYIGNDGSNNDYNDNWDDYIDFYCE